MQSALSRILILKYFDSYETWFGIKEIAMISVYLHLNHVMIEHIKNVIYYLRISVSYCKSLSLNKFNTIPEVWRSIQNQVDLKSSTNQVH